MIFSFDFFHDDVIVKLKLNFCGMGFSLNIQCSLVIGDYLICHLPITNCYFLIGSSSFRFFTMGLNGPNLCCSSENPSWKGPKG